MKAQLPAAPTPPGPGFLRSRKLAHSPWHRPDVFEEPTPDIEASCPIHIAGRWVARLADWLGWPRIVRAGNPRVIRDRDGSRMEIARTGVPVGKSAGPAAGQVSHTASVVTSARVSRAVVRLGSRRITMRLRGGRSGRIHGLANPWNAPVSGWSVWLRYPQPSASRRPSCERDAAVMSAAIRLSIMSEKAQARRCAVRRRCRQAKLRRRDIFGRKHVR
jgi:hypothetical protein